MFRASSGYGRGVEGSVVVGGDVHRAAEAAVRGSVAGGVGAGWQRSRRRSARGGCRWRAGVLLVAGRGPAGSRLLPHGPHDATVAPLFEISPATVGRVIRRLRPLPALEPAAPPTDAADRLWIVGRPFGAFGEAAGQCARRMRLRSRSKPALAVVPTLEELDFRDVAFGSTGVQRDAEAGGDGIEVPGPHPQRRSGTGGGGGRGGHAGRRPRPLGWGVSCWDGACRRGGTLTPVRQWMLGNVLGLDRAR